MAFEGTWKIFPLTMDEKTSYKLCEGDFYIRSDLEFVDSLLKDHRLGAEPQARGIILDLVCSELKAESKGQYFVSDLLQIYQGASWWRSFPA